MALKVRWLFSDCHPLPTNVLHTPVARLDGSICATADEVAKRWTEHYESTLNQSAANLCSELNDLAASATPDTSIAEDASTLEEVIRAVRHLRNGRAAGFDEIAPELLKYAEAPISQALHDLFSTVWSSGKVPVEWKEGIIVSLYKGKGSRSCCNSYRPISLSIHPSVFISSIMAK